MVIVKTNRNIIQDNNYSNCSGCSGIDGDYSNLDANSSTEEIQHFQKWINNKKGLNLTSGKWDDETAKLYEENGSFYDLIDNPYYKYGSTNLNPNTQKGYNLNPNTQTGYNLNPNTQKGYSLNPYTQKGYSLNPYLKTGYSSNNFKFKPTPSTKYVPTENTKDVKKEGMSMTTKILIGLGIFLVLGTTIYFITKKK
jgi:hypothetical protein